MSITTMTFAARDFSARRGASDEHTLQGSVRSEQRRLGQKEPPPEGLRRFSVLALLLLGHSPTAGDAPSSRLARTENRRNKRGRIYETGYLGLVQKQLLILGHTHPHPGPLPSDGRGRIVLRRSAYPAALETARDGSGCSLSRRTGEGQGEGRFVGNTRPVWPLFLHKTLVRSLTAECEPH